jgi:hypothetical protein
MNCLFFCFRLRPTKERKEKISRKTVHQQTKTKKKQNRKGKEDEKQIGTFASALLSPFSLFSATTEVSISS